MEVASAEDVENAIDIPGPVGTAVCMAAALKKDREFGMLDYSPAHFLFCFNAYSV